MLPNVTELRRTYERLDAAKLLRLATDQATSLRPEALEVLRQVIAERGLAGDEHVSAAIAVQFRAADPLLLAQHCALMRALPCPGCGSQAQLLNAIITDTVISYVLLTTRRKQLRLGCPACLAKRNNEAYTTSALFGWWGIPWGIMYTIQALVFNGRMQKVIRATEPTAFFQQFVQERLGRIEAHQHHPTELRLLLQQAMMA